MTKHNDRCADHQRYTEDAYLGVAYLDMFPCSDAAAVRTIQVTPELLIDVRQDTGEVAGIELLNNNSPLAKWLARAAAALAATRMDEIGFGINTAGSNANYITRI